MAADRLVSKSGGQLIKLLRVLQFYKILINYARFISVAQPAVTQQMDCFWSYLYIYTEF